MAMKIRQVHILMLLLLLPGAVTLVRGQSPSSQTSVELKEADDLSAQVVRLFGENRYEEALPLARRALKIREEKLGPNHPQVAAALTNLAEVYLAREKPDEAEPLYKKALAIYEKSSEAAGPRLGQLLDRLALIRYSKGDLDKAQELYERAIVIKERTAGQESEDVAQSLSGLVTLYNAKHEYGKVEPLLRRIVSIKEKSAGATSTDVARTLERLACVLYRNKEEAEAQKVEARAADILYKGKPEPVELSETLFGCKLLKNPYPKYPEAARRIAGARVILVSVEADETGRITSARMISGESAFKDASEQAAMSAQLRPTLIDGRPVKVKGVIKYQFMTRSSIMVVGPVPGGRRP